MVAQDKIVKLQELPFLELRYSTHNKKKFKTHMHQTLSIGVVEAGDVSYQVADKTERLREGSFALINPEIPHSCNAMSEDGRSFFMLYLDLDWCEALQEAVWDVSDFTAFSQIRLDDKSLYKDFLSLMHDILKQKEDAVFIEQRLVHIIADIFAKSSDLTTETIVGDRKLEKVRKALEADLDRDALLDDMAIAQGVNKFTLIRKFKKAYHLTPHEYRMNCRINLARRLLQQEQSVADVAVACGFYDQSHFHRHFKAMTTLTPYEYQVNFIQ